MEAIDVKYADIREKLKRDVKKLRGDLNVAADEFRHQRKRDKYMQENYQGIVSKLN